MKKRIAVIGAGGMARVRTEAFLATNKATICGVASRTLSSAQKFGDDIGCAKCFTDYHRLVETLPDTVLVEVPHAAQDDIVLWALNQGLHVQIGGCLASSSIVAEQIKSISESRGLVVEAGYDARYSAMWGAAKRLVTDCSLGKTAVVRSIALWDGDPKSWYYEQEISGGMPLTHMTYCFINPIRWILGDPLCVSALTNRIKHTATGMIEEETCVANLQFGDDVICNMTASFIKPGDVPGWSVLFLGTNGAIEILPEENTLIIYRDGRTETKDFSSARDAFEVQAEVFLAAIDGPDECRNTPDETIGDIKVAQAIVASSRQNKIVWIEGKQHDGQ
jgi:predicted dehydrogenase